MSDIEINLDEQKEVKKPSAAVDEIIVEEVADNKPSGLKVEDAIAELKNRLETEQKARKDAEKRAYDAERSVSVAKNEVADSNMHLISGAIETIKRDMSILKGNYKSALSSGNYEDAANIQEQMHTASNRLTRLEDGKQELEKRPKVEFNNPKSDDVVGEFASRLSPRSAEWIRKHPECVTDTALNQVMIGAHTMALGKRIPVDSPEYFSFIENAIGVGGDSENNFSNDSESTQKSSGGRQVSTNTSPASAPVSRTASFNGSTRPNVVRLSEAEREIADSMGMTYQDYGRNKLALQKSGKIN